MKLTGSELRPLKREDLLTILAWRNHPDINQYMFSQHKIRVEEHLAWFDANSRLPLMHFWLYLENNKPQGFIQLQQKSVESSVFEWGFYVNPEALSGTGTRMLRLGLKKTFIELQANRVFGEVLDFNDLLCISTPNWGLRKKVFCASITV